MGLRLRVLGTVLAVVPILTACSGSSDATGDARPTLEITLRAVEPVGDAELEQAVAVVEERLDRAGVDASVGRGNGSLLILLLDATRPDDADRAVELSTGNSRLELYDLEANLVPPSIDENRFPVAHSSLYDLLVGRQEPARKDDVETWYLFDAERKLAGGPAPSERLLLAGGGLLDGWRTLGVPRGTVVLECGVGEVVCPGVAVVEPSTNSYYLIRYDPPRVPELTADDIAGVAADVDTLTGRPIVTMQFTEEGADEFGRLTREEASRGERLSRALGGQKVMHHFAIVLDGEIKSWPSIDWEQYPDGISGSNGVQITGIGKAEAERLATILSTGVLPARFEVVSRRRVGG